MSMPYYSPVEATKLLRHCLNDGQVIPSRHFREELKNEDLELLDAYQVLKQGRIYDAPEPDIKTGEWKYRIEGNETGGKWLAIVFTLKTEDSALLITVFSVKIQGKIK